MRILIAEDDMASAVYLRKILSFYGECAVATDGIKAIEAFVEAYQAGRPFDLVCLDIMLPRMDGIQVLRTIREIISEDRGKSAKTKIIIVSALNDQEMVDNTSRMGCDAYLWKPYSIEKIEEVLKNLEFQPK
jgi:two-component system chemotaxis response regulator CheY